MGKTIKNKQTNKGVGVSGQVTAMIINKDRYTCAAAEDEWDPSFAVNRSTLFYCFLFSFLSVSNLAMSPRVVHGKGSHVRDGIRGRLAIFSRRMGEPLFDAMARVPIVCSLMGGRLFVHGLQGRLFVGWCEHRRGDRRYGWGWRYDGGAWRG